MRWMDPTLKFSMLLMLLGLISILVNASHLKSDFGYCERVVKKWAFSSLDQEVKEDRHTLQDLMFFLHVPRTGGRTYFHCFLKKLYSRSLECPRSYDKLRFDPSKPKCKLLVTHDDYSMMSKLPSQRTSVVTILRNPVDRVFSTYEFSVEVAARFLVHPNLTSATKMAGRLRAKIRGVSTLDIWPWKYLVPWMREDLFARRDARRQRHSDDVKSNDSYDMEDMVMPLHEYINNPIAHDILHNGATFQVAGLTNNSYLAESHEVRHCVQQYKILGEHVLQVAKKRLGDMLYVGLTEEHKESATMFANVVGAQVISQRRASNMSMGSVTHDKPEQSSSFTDSEPEDNDHQNSTFHQNAGQLASTDDGEVTKGNMTVEELMGAYEVCISSLRKEQARRRTASLKRIAPANFSKEARLQVPEVVLQQIRSLNNLDLELYKYAQDIFAKQHKRTMEKLVTRGGRACLTTHMALCFVKSFC
ncbi:protein-tyrosine sulfotransferase isoform X2 [Alnus glutinosa]|uniref:protein-tyrosine sulfotransferase isoform X2 n=1 Tax=Alnus glutinosa TaxID=3517 RepID=UPI002D773C51|nr:protein-tyrosine sulfotransferase isoform X2 [Alnus glutinosa]